MTNSGKEALVRSEDKATIRDLPFSVRDDTEMGGLGVEANLLQCASMALFYGCRMGTTNPEAINALAALCLVLGDRRGQFFESVFLKHIMLDPSLTPTEKLNRIVRIAIATVPRP